MKHQASQLLGGFTSQFKDGLRQVAPDYEKIRGMVREELALLPKPEKPEQYDDSKLHGRIDSLSEESGKSMAQVSEYLRNELETQSKKLSAEFNSKLASVKDAVISFFDRHSEQDGSWDAKLESGLAEIKESVASLLTEEKLEEKMESLEGNAAERHAELLEEMGKPIPLVMSRKVEKEPKQEKQEPQIDQKAAQRKMTVDRLINLSKK